jgi:hypothetical protein
VAQKNFVAHPRPYAASGNTLPYTIGGWQGVEQSPKQTCLSREFDTVFCPMADRWGQFDGQLFFPVFLSGTSRSNSARRGEAWQSVQRVANKCSRISVEEWQSG